MAAGARFGGFGDERRDLLGGLRAQPRHPAGKGIVPARLVGEVVCAEAFHAIHQLNGFLFVALLKEFCDLTERFSEELGGESGEFGAGVRIVRVDADNRA